MTTPTPKSLRQVISYNDDGTLHVDLMACMTCGAVIHPDLHDLHQAWHFGQAMKL